MKNLTYDNENARCVPYDSPAGGAGIEALRRKISAKREDVEEMAKLTLDTPREQYWCGCWDALTEVLNWIQGQKDAGDQDETDEL